MTSPGIDAIDAIDAEVRREVADLVGLDPVATLRYFDNFYLAPLARHMDIQGASLLDCACGTGWLAMAARMRGAGHVVAADLYPGTIEKARAVARLLGLEDQIEWATANVTQLPFDDRQFDVVCSIETLEHVPVIPASRELARVCARFFVVETINRRFPIDTHDTPYPLAHYLTKRIRRRVNTHYGTTEMNRYPSWGEVEAALTDFTLRTPFKTFADPGEWEAVFPYENPYLSGRPIDLAERKWRLKRWYYRANYACLGASGRYGLDKIMGIYERGRHSHDRRGGWPDPRPVGMVRRWLEFS